LQKKDSGVPESAQALLVLACGALAHEIQYLKNLNHWSHMEIQCLDAELHNRPWMIAGKLKKKIEQNRGHFERIFVAYADCGSSGQIDKLLSEEGIERLPGAHCYSAFAGEHAFLLMSQREPASFYLTDFLARHFDRLVIKGLKLDSHPELRSTFFGNYRKVVYLSQTNDRSLMQLAASAAKFLEVDFEHVHCGYGDVETALRAQIIAVG
jgi:hypothetical protein